MNNKFKIIIPSYNNEDWIECNVSSVLNQTYTNYEVLYINDTSTDNTLNKINELKSNYNLDNWTIINNLTNKGAMYNYFEHLNDFITDDEDILIHLDGDDWLYDENVLEKLNNFYNDKECWMTYGGFVCYGDQKQGSALEEEITTKLPYPQNTPYPDFIHDYKLYRKDQWRASHLRTFKGFLINSLDKNDLRSLIDKNYYWHAADLAMMFPCMEMCGKERIGVVDFYTCVYNQSNENTVVRTQERESEDNKKYEVEIRNRKKYREGINKGKLPLVNCFGAGVEICSMPTKFSYCFEQTDGEFDMVLLNDGEILDYLNGNIGVYKNVPIVARLHEQRDYFQKNLMNTVLNNHDKFHTILTFDKIILENAPNARFCNADGITQFVVCPNNLGGKPYHSELYNNYDVDQTIKIYPKTNFTKASCITTNKAFLPGHSTRLNFIKNIKDKVELYGRGIREIPSKLDAMHNYAFSVAIENNISSDDYYFTEKLIECFTTGTVPIYYGCPNIDKFFDIRGVLTFTTQEELDNILDNLSEEKYNSMLEYINYNFNKCVSDMVLHNDSLYDLHLKQIINDITI